MLDDATMPMKALVGGALSPDRLDGLGIAWPQNVERIIMDGCGPEEILNLIEDVDSFTGLPSLDMLQRARRLKLVNVLGHGMDFALDPEYRRVALEKRIAFCKSQTADVAIAEHVIASMICLSRRTFMFHDALAYRTDPSIELRTRLRTTVRGELFGSTLGILGFGAIGRAVAERARGFKMTIGALARRPERIDTQHFGVSFTASFESLSDFLGRCDYVVATLPSTPETDGCLGAAQFAAMKDGAYFVNIARGSLVHDEALYHALESGKLAGAALDVWNANVRIQGNYPFPHPIHHFNVIMTPHFSAGTLGTWDRAFRFAVDNIRRLAAGEPLLHVADLEAGY